MLDLNQAIVFRERCIQTQEDLLQQLANREQEVQDPATDCEDEKDADVKNEVDVGKLVLPLPPDELDDPFEEVEDSILTFCARRDSVIVYSYGS